MMTRLTVGVVLTAIAGGCGVSANLPRRRPIEIERDEAVLVLGVRPKFHVHIVEGRRLSDGSWAIEGADIPKGNLAPENEYIVIKLAPTSGDEEYGVSMVWDETRESMTLIGACRGSNTLAFGLPAGQPTYVGDLILHQTERGLVAHLEFDPARMKQRLSADYPLLVGRLRMLPAREKRVANGVGGGGIAACLLAARNAGAVPKTAE